MEITVLNENFDVVYILEKFESFLWVDKFAEPGTFELYSPVSNDLLTYMKPDYYIMNSESEHIMIIEDTSIESDIENGGKIKVIGRSLESILDRRIVWSQTNIKGNLQTGIQTLLNNAIISPSDNDRKIDNFIFTASSDPVITAMTMDHQFTGDNLLDVVAGVCSEAGIGFKVLRNSDGKFEFTFYNGTNRSYSQSTNPYVVFSPNYDNLLSSNYVEMHSTLKNVALVAGEGEGTNRKTATAGSGTGLARKELYVDARNLSRTNGSSTMSVANYQKKLESKGKEELARIKKESTYFDGECDTSRMYKYGSDFFMGDYVQMENEYGLGDKTRVTEFTWSISTNGTETYPTFTKDKDE